MYPSVLMISSRSLSSKASAAVRRSMMDRMIRVNHAGEYGANRIYEGQHAILGSTESGPLIRHMWEQEKEHLRIFEDLMQKHRARPTALLPLWDVAGFALGAGTALLGKEAAMACTVAVEDSITQHYDDQIRQLLKDDPELHKDLIERIAKIRDEEQEHHDVGLEQEAEQAPLYSALSFVIKTGCKTAIWVAERI